MLFRSGLSSIDCSPNAQYTHPANTTSTTSTMSSAIHSIAPPGVETRDLKKKPTFFERLANALVYVIAFPFIAVFIGLRRIFTEQKGPAHSYYNRLPEQHMLGGQAGQTNGQSAVGAGSSASPGGPEGVSSRTRSKKA